MADEQPAAYLSLLAKLLPLEASLDAGPGQFVVSWLPPTN
jgi:hypothetical protein